MPATSTTLGFMQEILINWMAHETRAAVLENGQLRELHIERACERSPVGNIFMGKVSRVLPGIQAAFVDIGLEQAGFLHAAELPSAFLRGRDSAQATQADNGDNNKHNSEKRSSDKYSGSKHSGAAQSTLPPVVPPPPIEKQLSEGQVIMVQVMKAPIGGKGARLSMQISIAGRQLVFLPQDTHIGVSQKIPEELRESLRLRLLEVAKQAAQQIDGCVLGGYILRTNAGETTDEQWLADMNYLQKTWAHITDQSHKAAAATAVYVDLNLSQRVLRDMVNEDTTAVRVDDAEHFRQLTDYARQFMPGTAARLMHYDSSSPIFALYSVESAIAKALCRRVELPSGGSLIIDQTEAMTTIDVNTGRFVGGSNFAETILKTNLEAAQTLAWQLRLRNLGGIIVVDFIDMEQPEHQQAVLDELRSQLASDKARTSVSAFSELGLVEMTRKRTRESLNRTLFEPCKVCDAKGRIKTARTVAYEILRELHRQGRQFRLQMYKVIAHPDVIELLSGEESQHLLAITDAIGKKISLQSDASLAQEAFDIVLMQPM